jgi:hypothetical protein
MYGIRSNFVNNWREVVSGLNQVRCSVKLSGRMTPGMRCVVKIRIIIWYRMGGKVPEGIYLINSFKYSVWSN